VRDFSAAALHLRDLISASLTFPIVEFRFKGRRRRFHAEASAPEQPLLLVEVLMLVARRLMMNKGRNCDNQASDLRNRNAPPETCLDHFP
jgi:hypothetical protein